MSDLSELMGFAFVKRFGSLPQVSLTDFKFSESFGMSPLHLDAGIFSISGRSVSTLIKNHGIGDLNRIYATAQIDGTDFNLAAIPSKFSVRGAEPFEQTYMQALYEGYRARFQGYPWMKVPPGLANPRLQKAQYPEHP